MSKNKKAKSGSKQKQQFAGVNKHEKSKNKHPAGRPKIKNKQNIRDTVLSKSKSKQNVKNNVMFKSKIQQMVKDSAVSKSQIKRNVKDNSAKSTKSRSLKRLNVRKLKSMLNAKESGGGQSLEAKKKSVTPPSLRERMLAQLKASRFRFLNEQMYSNDSSQSKKYFQDDPQAFYAYHEGYKQQVERWPLNPVDVIIESIQKMYGEFIHFNFCKWKMFKRSWGIEFTNYSWCRSKDLVVADFGCGEAKLADSVPQKVHSFDLVAVNDKVTACDMAQTSLLTGRVNVAVFCLSLMGSNLKDYLLEANRILETK